MTDPIKKLREDMLPILGRCSLERQHEVLAVIDAFAADAMVGTVTADDAFRLVAPDFDLGGITRGETYDVILVPRKTVSLLEAAEELCDAVAEILPPASASTRLENAHAAAAAAIKRAGGGE